MNIASLLSPELIIPELESRERCSVISEMVEHLHLSGHVSTETHENTVSILNQREDMVSTGIGHGVAVPHAFLDHLSFPVAAFGRSSLGIDFDAIDSKPVYFVILLLIPANESFQHLQTLASIARFFYRPEVIPALREARTPSQIISIFHQYS